MLYRGYFSLAHWSNAGEQFWVRYCAEFHADVFQSGGGALRKLAARKMQELKAGGIRIDKVDLIADAQSGEDTVNCVGVYSPTKNGNQQMEFLI